MDFGNDILASIPGNSSDRTYNRQGPKEENLCLANNSSYPSMKNSDANTVK